MVLSGAASAMEVPEEVHHVQRILSSMQKTLECRICLDLFDEPSQTKCGHTFCTECLHQLTKKPAPCPLCKERLTRRSFAADHQAAALATAVRRLVAAVQEDCGFNGKERVMSPSKFRPRPSIEAIETNPARQTVAPETNAARQTAAPSAGRSAAAEQHGSAAAGGKKTAAKNVRTTGRGRHRRSPPRHVYSRAAAVADDELDLLSASQVLEFDGERVGESLAPPPPPLPADAERRVSGRTRVNIWIGEAREAGFGISEVESPTIAKLDKLREKDGGRLERRLMEEKRRLGVAPLDDAEGEADKENRLDVSGAEGTVGGKGDARRVVDESVDDGDSAREQGSTPAPATAKRFFKARASAVDGTTSGETQTQTQTEGTETAEEDPYFFISSQRTPPKKKKKRQQRTDKKTKPSAAKKLTVTKKPRAAGAGSSDGPAADFDELDAEAAASRRRAPPRRARQAAVRAAEFLALPGDTTLSQESAADSDFEPPVPKKTRRDAHRATTRVAAKPAPVTPKLQLARAELGTASQEVRVIQELFDDAAPPPGQVTPRGGRRDTMTRAEALRKSEASEQEEAVTPKSVTFSEDVTVKEIPRVRREAAEKEGIDGEEMRGVAEGERETDQPERPVQTSQTGGTWSPKPGQPEPHASKPGTPKTQTAHREASKPPTSNRLSAENPTAAGENAGVSTAAEDDSLATDHPGSSQCDLSAGELAAAGLPPPAAARSPGWSRLPRLKSSFGLKAELNVKGGRRTPTKEDRHSDGPPPIVPFDAADDAPPSPTSRIDEEVTASSGDDVASEGFTASQPKRMGKKVRQYREAVKELEDEVMALETETECGGGERAGEVVPETEMEMIEDGPGCLTDAALEGQKTPGGVVESATGGGEISDAEDVVELEGTPPPLLSPQAPPSASAPRPRSSRSSAPSTSAGERQKTRLGSRGAAPSAESESLLRESPRQADSELPASEAAPPPGPPPPDSEDYQVDVGVPSAGRRRSGRSQSGRLSRSSPRGSVGHGADRDDNGQAPAAPAASPSVRRAGAGAGRRRAVRVRRAVPSRRLLVRLLAGQRRLTALVGRLTSELSRASSAQTGPAAAAGVQAVLAAVAQAQAATAALRSPSARRYSSARAAAGGASLSVVTPAFSPSRRRESARRTTPTATAGAAATPDRTEAKEAAAAGEDLVPPSQSSPSPRGELSALMRQNPVPAPESAPSVGFPADSEEIGPMSVTQFDRVAREMAAEAAPPPPRDLCDLDTEEVDQLMEEPPAPPPRETTGLERDESETAAAPADQSSQASAPGDEADTKRRSGSVGSQKRASSPLGSAVGSKRPRSQPVTPASAAKGSKEDPEVVSDDDEDLLSEGDGLQVIQDDATDDEAEPEPPRELDEFASDAEDRVEIERLAAMPVDEFIREIQGEVCGAPVGESTRRLSEDDEDGRQDARGEKSITDSMLQQVDLPPADESICEVPADSSLAVCEDESIVEGEGRQSRPSAGRSLGDIDPDLAGAADPAPPGSQDSLAEIVASSGEVVASPGRVAHLDTVLPAPESDLIPSSPVGLEGSPPRRRSGLSARSPPRPPAATSPSSEDLLVPPGFFNESSMCVPAAETSVRDTSARDTSARDTSARESDTSRGGAEQAEATRQQPARTSPSAAAAPDSTNAPDPAAAPDPSGVRRAVLPSAASAASDRAGTPTTAAAAAATAAAAAGGGGDAAEVSETESEDMFSASRPTETAGAAGRKKDSPPPPPPRPPPVMVASGLKRPEQEAAQRLAAAHGGRFLRQWQPGVTHVIVRTGPRLEAGRTLKFLQGVAARAWLVAAAWVEDSLAAGRLLPEEDYEAIDSATGEPGPRRARQTGGALFADFTFCCVGPFRDVTMEQLESLIGQSGGAVASSPAALASAPGRVRLIVAQEECDHDFSGWRRRHGLPSVSYEWLIDCVATQRLWSLLDNTLCGASEAELRQAGVPPELCLAETQETEYFDSMGL
ncbi:Breast cancer type 1 susceptibility [Amphibalanus amphitrite]|uniref:RING-type E3 ubiquitin transferase BRCA1 n=1 Tax=Amphibalanus amphitrite TaxID=1232801 RepID=A0A6A4WJ73_AMPAM|nr:Breast cancer type 1 susceptibility [Amphibalanus amphitrite]